MSNLIGQKFLNLPGQRFWTSWPATSLGSLSSVAAFSSHLDDDLAPTHLADLAHTSQLGRSSQPSVAHLIKRLKNEDSSHSLLAGYNFEDS